MDPHISNVLSLEPENVEALELKTEAEACVKSNLPPPPGPQMAVKIPPADGGLEPLPGERDRDYQLRVKAMRANYDDAVITASKGPSRAAISQFEAIAKETPPGYLDVSAKLAEVTRAWRATAKPLVTEANNLAAKGMWNEALQKFREARVIDPSLSFDDEIRKIDAAKLADGLQQCKLGKQTINYNPATAVEHFKRAMALLSPDDPCYAIAKKYVAVAATSPKLRSRGGNMPNRLAAIALLATLVLASPDVQAQIASDPWFRYSTKPKDFQAAKLPWNTFSIELPKSWQLVPGHGDILLTAVEKTRNNQATAAVVLEQMHLVEPMSMGDVDNVLGKLEADGHRLEIPPRRTSSIRSSRLALNASCLSSTRGPGRAAPTASSFTRFQPAGSCIG